MVLGGKRPREVIRAREGQGCSHEAWTPVSRWLHRRGEDRDTDRQTDALFSAARAGLPGLRQRPGPPRAGPQPRLPRTTSQSRSLAGARPRRRLGGLSRAQSERATLRPRAAASALSLRPRPPCVPPRAGRRSRRTRNHAGLLCAGAVRARVGPSLHASLPATRRRFGQGRRTRSGKHLALHFFAAGWPRDAVLSWGGTRSAGDRKFTFPREAFPTLPTTTPLLFPLLLPKT